MAVQPTQNDIVLKLEISYTLEVSFENTQEDEDVTEEIKEEDEEHMIFFGWTQGLFTNPDGDGNIGAGNRNDSGVYDDSDENMNPLGVLTTWITGEVGAVTFTILLKHQPDLK